MPPWCRTTWRARFLLAPSSMIPSCFQKTTHGAKCWEVPAPTRRVSPYTYTHHITGNRFLVSSIKRLGLPEPHSKMFNIACGMRAQPRSRYQRASVGWDTMIARKIEIFRNDADDAHRKSLKTTYRCKRSPKPASIVLLYMRCWILRLILTRTSTGIPT